MLNKQHIMNNTKTLKAGDVVKYSRPTEDEKDFRFHLLVNNGDRVSIQLICDYRIRPIETVATDEVELA